MREAVWIDPPYQRMSDIWSLEKRQLLIDSILNGFDIPKLYFHVLVPPKKVGTKPRRHAIIDGKQRLQAIWDFVDGQFSLADDFAFLLDDSIDAGGLSYPDLADKHPSLRARFDATQLSVMLVRTDDIELIEDMFSRLNEAVPLNAPEKRNAFGGTMVKAIRLTAKHELFVRRLPFKDKRYKHQDLAAKFLWIEYNDEVVDTKKVYLDTFVKDWKFEDRTAKDANSLRDAVERHLERMCRVFVNDDPLLRSIGMTVVVYHLFRLLEKERKISKIKRDHFEAFDLARAENRRTAEQDLTEADYGLLEFEKYVQSPNDAFATRLRLAILVKFLRENTGIELSKDHDYYNLVP